MEASLLIRLIDQVTGPGGKVVGALKKVGEAAGELKRGFGDAIRQGFSVDNIETASRNAEAALSRARSRLLGAVATTMALAAPVKLAGAFDQAIKGLDKVLDVPVDRLAQLRKFALDTSALIPIAARDLVDLMSEAAQGGVPQQELEAFSRYVANAAVAFDMAGQEIGERFAKLRNVYRLTQEGIEDLGDATNFLSNNMAAKASEVTDFANRAAGAAKIFHLTATQTAAVGAAMIAAGIVPETAARGFTAMATRVLSGGKEVDKAFKSIGISRKTFLKELEKDGPAALTKLFQTMAGSKKGMEALIGIVGRDFADDFAKFLGNPDLLVQALQMISDKAAYAGSAVDEASKQAAGSEKRWDLLMNKLARMGVIFGDQLLPPLLEAADAIGHVVDQVAAFAQAHPDLSSAVVQTAAGLLALSVAGRVFAWGVAGLRVGILRILPLFLKFNAEGRNVAAGWRAIAGAVRGVGAAAGAANRRLGGLQNTVRGAIAASWVIPLVFEFVDDMGRSPEERLDQIRKNHEAWKRFEEKVEQTSFGQGWQSVKDRANAMLGLEQGQSPAAALGAWLEGQLKALEESREAFGIRARAFGNRLATAIGEGWQDGIATAKGLFDELKAHLEEKIQPIRDLFKFDLELTWPEPPAWLNWLIERGRGLVGQVGDAASGKGAPATASGAADGGFRAWLTGQWDSLVGSGQDLANELLGAGTTAGDRLGGTASQKLQDGAAAAGALFGRAAAAEIGKARISTGTGAVAGALATAKSGALHDGVD